MPSGTAIFELQVKLVNRTHKTHGTRQSAIAGAAYRAGADLLDEQTGITHSYSNKGDVHTSTILAPTGAPEWTQDRQTLWNNHDAKEKQHNSQLYREVQLALPRAFDTETNIEMTLDWVNANFVSRGMVADVSFHKMEEGDSNPHAHIMLTMRHLENEGFGNKNRTWNKYNPVLKLPKEIRDEQGIQFKSQVAEWRASWCLHVNEELEKEGIDAQISHLKKAEQEDIENLEREHIALAAHHMEQRGVETQAAEQKQGAGIRNSARRQKASFEKQLTDHYGEDSHESLAAKIAHKLKDYASNFFENALDGQIIKPHIERQLEANYDIELE